MHQVFQAHVGIHKLHLRVLQLDKWNGRWENNFAGLSGELQGGSRRRLLTRSRMSKRNFERKLTTYSTRSREGLCANTHTRRGSSSAGGPSEELTLNWLCTTSLISLCNLCVLCVSVVVFPKPSSTTEAQRTQRLHREEHV
jgi:hypothetical protein